MRKHLFVSLFWLLGICQLFATHNRAGEIIFTKLGGLKVQVSIITISKASSVNADRDSLTIAWGDGSTLTALRINGNGEGELLGNDRKKNIYTAVHDYLAQGTYYISMTDPNRNAGILNLNPPFSDNIPFHLEAMIRLSQDAEASSQSPVFLELPVDDAYTFQPYVHIPNAFDPDGDSLAYELVTPMQGPGQNVPNFSLPDQISPGDDNKITFDPVTGIFNWTTPIIPGAYNIAILVKSYRNGQLVESTLRDITIDVYPYTNYPPQLALNPDISEQEIVPVQVGQDVTIAATASAEPEPDQQLTLSAGGGPFEAFFQEKATFTVSGNQGLFHWHVGQEYLREQPYQIVFKVKDDYLGAGLATLRSVRFKVVEAVGIGEITETEGFQCAPNPAGEATVVRFQKPLEKATEIRLLDGNGRIVRVLQVCAGEQTCELQLTGLPTGIYRAAVRGEAGCWQGLNLVKN